MTRWLTLLVTLSLLWVGPAWGQSAGDWTNSFEASPADGDPISAGAGKIRGTRNETRDRSEVETCFGAQHGDGCATTDDGRHRLGSARSFFVATEPAAIHAADNTAGEAVTLDDARLWIASDQGEDSNGDSQEQGGRAYVYDATAADGHDGTGAFENVVALSMVDYAEVKVTDPDADWFTHTAWTSWNNAASAPATCDVTVPENGNWRVFAEFNVTLSSGTAGSHIAVRLCNATVATCVGGAGGTVLLYQGCEKCGDPTNNSPPGRGLSDKYVADATPNATAIFDLEMRLDDGGLIGDINAAGSVTDDDPDSWLRCWVEPRI